MMLGELIMDTGEMPSTMPPERTYERRNSDMLKLTDDYLADLMVRMAHHSTAIEGNTLTQGETKSILIDEYIPRAMDMRELHEVLNYKAFMPFMRESLEDGRTLSLSLIKEMHKILCHEAIGSVPGEFKKIPNAILGADFETTPPYMVPMALTDWLENLAAQLAASPDDHARIEAICRQHIAFEHIHPFPDGNGRVGRALMVWSCLEHDMLPAVVPVEHRREYINYLNTENLAALTAFAEQLQKQEKLRYQALCQ